MPKYTKNQPMQQHSNDCLLGNPRGFFDKACPCFACYSVFLGKTAQKRLCPVALPHWQSQHLCQDLTTHCSATAQSRVAQCQCPPGGCSAYLTGDAPIAFERRFLRGPLLRKKCLKSTSTSAISKNMPQLALYELFLQLEASSRHGNTSLDHV